MNSAVCHEAVSLYRVKDVGVDTVVFSVRGHRSYKYRSICHSSNLSCLQADHRWVLLGNVPFRLQKNPPMKVTATRTPSNYCICLVLKIPSRERKRPQEALRIDAYPRGFQTDVLANVRSPLLRELGVVAAVALTQELIQDLFDLSNGPPIFTLSRVDLKADIALPSGFCIMPEEIVTLAETVCPHLSDVIPCFNYRIGSRHSRILARLYAKSKHTYRVEFSLQRPFFRKLNDPDLSDVLRQSPEIWSYLTQVFLIHTYNKERRDPSPFWRAVQGAAEDFRRFQYCDARKSFRSRRPPSSAWISKKDRQFLLDRLQKGLSKETMPLWTRMLFALGYSRKTIAVLAGVSERTVSKWLSNPLRSRRGRRLAYQECYEILERFLKGHPDPERASALPNLRRALAPCRQVPRSTLYRYRKRVLSKLASTACAPPSHSRNEF